MKTEQGEDSFDDGKPGGKLTAAMLSPVLEKVLVLQDRDTHRLGLEAQLRTAPDEIAAVERQIAAEKESMAGARAAWQGLETQKKGLETEIRAAAETLGKYKTQQMAVRKNDEYQALGHQIATVEAQIGELEGKELEVMYAIDTAKHRLAEAEAAAKRNVALLEGRIAALKERTASVQAELQGAVADVTAARAPLDEAVLRQYDRIAAQHHPACVPVRDGKCGGCHLRVSSDVASVIRGKVPDGELAACDQCGRLVYLES